MHSQWPPVTLPKISEDLRSLGTVQPEFVWSRWSHPEMRICRILNVWSIYGNQLAISFTCTYYITLHTYKVYRYMCHYLRMILYDYKLKSCHVSFQRLVLNEEAAAGGIFSSSWLCCGACTHRIDTDCGCVSSPLKWKQFGACGMYMSCNII